MAEVIVVDADKREKNGSANPSNSDSATSNNDGKSDNRKKELTSGENGNDSKKTTNDSDDDIDTKDVGGGFVDLVDNDDDDDDDEIEEEQIEEYSEMVNHLGTFPDKVKINSLSMVAEDHNESKKSASALYDCIRKPLISHTVSKDRKLPLVYVIDSILKNVGGTFIPIIEEDAKVWMPNVFEVLSLEQRAKLRKVWNTWKGANIFNEKSWKEIGNCFLSADEKVETKTKKAGIIRAADGSLKLPPALRTQMQSLLDEMHVGVSELDKVSLERLADINPDLLVEIKTAAEDTLASGQSNGSGSISSGHPGGTSSQGAPQDQHAVIFTETRSQAAIERSKEWDKLSINHLETSHELIANLQRYVMVDSSSNQTYTQPNAIYMTSLLACAGATATHLTNSLQRIKDQEDNKNNTTNNYQNTAITSGGGGMLGTTTSGSVITIDKTLFTNDGIKKKNDSVIGSLYEIGLPFLSSSDGRRFRTQEELSNHLDSLFKKNQLEKSMERTIERGWYAADEVWTLKVTIQDANGSEAGLAAEATTGDGTAAAAGASSGGMDDANTDPSIFTVPADETRDRCVICGINFKMFFDNDDGIYKYSNCRDVDVLQDDVAENDTESMLVHVTCWRGLGCPNELTMDQALQDKPS